jgi:hypothetical protein
MTPGAAHAAAFLAGGVLILGALAVTYAAREVAGIHKAQNQLHQQQAALARAQERQCKYWLDLGNAAAIPVTVNPVTHKASKLGIAIVSDSREAWAGNPNCTGRLAKPSPSFKHWAAVYHLPVT